MVDVFRLIRGNQNFRKNNGCPAQTLVLSKKKELRTLFQSLLHGSMIDGKKTRLTIKILGSSTKRTSFIQSQMAKLLYYFHK